MPQRARLASVSPARFVLSLFIAALLVSLGAADVRVQAQGGSAPAVQTLIPGRDVNMVSGTKWPDGDPYLQRQNEPSVAASTRNPLHLLAGSNDYRTVDIPNPADGGGETGDAWLGIFKSFDGGQRWQTSLLPGYPQDQSPEGQASPLRGYQAGADPVVRAGTNGLFYYAGLVFDRAENGRSAIFVARFIDNNNREDNYKASRLEPLTGRPQFIPEHQVGDPITYLDTAVVASNGGRRFFDKPWMAVDIPRSGQTCAIPGPGGTIQNLPAGDVYVVFSSIDGDARLGLRSEILLTRSSDCGVTWTRPTRISDPRDRINQGATIAIDPRNGTVHVAWRRFASDVRNQPDGLVAVRSTDRGRRFTAPGICRALTRGNGRKVGLKDFEQYFEHRKKKRRQKPKTGSPVDVTNSLESFDQPTSEVDQMFRTNAYPTMAIDGTGRIYLAWSERGFTSNPADDARIVISTSTDGRFWTAPVPVANEGQEGHQIMPALVFGGGRLVLVYYDLREDYSGQYTEVIDDRRAIQLGGKRHTLDLRASMGRPGPVPQFDASVRVSDYLTLFKRGTGNTLVEQQAQFNPPNLPMFKQGTAPFMGDYVDVTVAPAFVPTTNGRWAFNTGGALPVFHAVWTDNRDVRQPAPGLDGKPDWTKYTAPTQRAAAPSATSLFDPAAELPACDPQNTGSRNQNVYSARLSMGLVAGSPGNAKPLHPSIQRAFVVFAQNTTDDPKSFRMTIASQPQGGRASFRQFDANAAGDDLGPLTTIIVTTPARSTAARSVYATSSNPTAQIPVDVLEVPYGSTVPAVPLSDRVVLNPDIANPDIANPDIANPDIANPDIANAEVYNPDIANPDIANPNIANPDIANPNIANPDIANPDIANPDIANPDIANPDIANPDIANVQVANPDIANPDIANPDIANPDIANPDIANPDIANPDIANSSLTDVTWTMVNNGNTTSAFNVNLFLSQDATAQICADGEAPVGTTGCISTQLIVRKVYNTPTTTGCELQVQTQNVVVTNIQNPRFVTPGQPLPDQNDSAEENATVWLAPGETAKITLRVYDPNKSNNVGPADNDPNTPTNPSNLLIDPIFLPTTETSLGSVTPVIQQQAVDTEDVAAVPPGAAPPQPPIVTPLSPPVPSGDDDPAQTPVTVSFTVEPTSGLPAGTPIVPPVKVLVLDQYGNPLENAVVTLYLASNPSAATLIGSVDQTDASGIAQFDLLAVSVSGEGYTLAATSGQALPDVSVAFDAVSPCDPLVVTTTADSGCGSLRSAIEYANSTAGVQTVTFTIPGDLPHDITPLSSLPDITESVIIDGTSDPHFAIDQEPVITIDGTDAGGTGLHLVAGASTIKGLSIVNFAGTGGYGVFVRAAADGSVIEKNDIGTDRTHAAGLGNQFGVHVLYPDNITITGNAIAGNVENGVLIVGGTGNAVTGNFIGTDHTAETAVPNGAGIVLYDGALNTSIQGNWISGNTGWGIDIQHSGSLGQVTGTQILGNTIGLDTHDAALGNSSGGVRIQNAPGTIVGGPPAVPGEPSRGNVISGNGGHAILVFGNGSGVTIQGNRIGTNPAGTGTIPNVGAGVDVREGAAGVIISNTIAGNTGAGVVVWQNATGTTVSENAIYSNGGLGVDLDNNGVTPNDLADADAGSNNLQNYAVLSSAATGQVDFALDSPAGTYTLEFFANSACDPSGYGEGQMFLGTLQTSGLSGTAFFATPAPVGWFITATATDPGGNTSEFSNCEPISATAAAGGSGGTPFGTFTCSDGSFATGFRVNTDFTYALTSAEMLCSNGTSTPKFGGGTVPNTNVACAPGEVMVGFFGTAGAAFGPGSNVITSVGARCQNPTGGAITQVGPLPGGGTPFGPFECPAGQAVVGVLGGNGAVVDRMRLACGPHPAFSTITSIVPGDQVGGSQMVTIYGTNLPATGLNDVLLSQNGGPEVPAQYVWAATPSRVIARLPGLIPGAPTTLRLKNPAGTLTTNTVPLTVSSIAGAPVLTAVLSSCAGSPITNLASQGAFAIEADGIDTSGTSLVWTPVSPAGSSITQVSISGNLFSSTGGPTGRVCTYPQAGAPVLSPGTWQLQIATGNSALSNAIQIIVP